SGMPGVPARYVEQNGQPFVPNRGGSFASKDVYTAIFNAYNTAVPILHDGPVKDAALADVRAMTDNFIAHDFAFVGTNPGLGVTEFESFNPGMTLAELSDLARSNPQLLPQMVDTLARLKEIGDTRWHGIPIVLIGVGFMSVSWKNTA